MSIARNYISTGSSKVALIIGAEKLSGMVNWEDRNTCVLFGDGAGAAVLRASEPGKNQSGVISTYLGLNFLQDD